jgi:DNA-binding response OmpR family regulator
MKLPYRLLVIDDDENALCGMGELLREAGHDVTTTPSYEEARQLLSVGSYDLLITDVRLGSFNGLHLVMKIRTESPETAIIIMTAYDNSLMELEARRYNAALVRKPIKPAEFLEAVAHSLSGVRRQRRWPRKRVVGGFRVTAAGKPAAVLDVCYGGLRLEMPPAESVPAAFDVEVAGINLNLEVEPVWAYTAADGAAIVCGATLISESTPAARAWRTIVDRLNA